MNMCNEKCKSMCICAKIGLILLIIGGLNWGLIGIGMLIGSDLNVVNMILGSMPTFEAIVYVLVGVAALMKIFGCKCKKNMEAHSVCCGAVKVEEKI